MIIYRNALLLKDQQSLARVCFAVANVPPNPTQVRTCQGGSAVDGVRPSLRDFARENYAQTTRDVSSRPIRVKEGRMKDSRGSSEVELPVYTQIY